MNYFKTGILVFAFVFLATNTYAQSEPIPTLYGDKGGPAESVSEEVAEPASEVMSEEEEESASMSVSEEETESVPVAEGEEEGSNMWYWIIAILAVVGGLLWFIKSRKTDTSVS